MLESINIKNVALISELFLEFSPNFTVLSGETGAGKSIIIDSLNFVIGSKTSKTLIKQGCDFMEVTASFKPPFSKNILKILEDFGIEYSGELILSRKMSQDGRGFVRINGEIVPLSTLKKLTTYLVDIHGQHEHQKVLNDKYHLGILDGFLRDDKLFSEYTDSYEALKKVNDAIKKLNSSTQNQERMLDLLSYQIKEIEDADIKPGEDEILGQKKLIMQNAQKIYDSLNSAYSELEGERSISQAFKNASSDLSSIVRFDSSLASLVDKLDSLKFDTMDIAETIKEKRNECEFDKEEYDTVDERLDKIKLLKMKYGSTLKDVFDFLRKSKKEYEEISNSKTLLLEKLDEKEHILGRLFEIGSKISEKRREIARSFERQTNSELKDLGMSNARFSVKFDSIPARENLESSLHPSGFDNILFLFSANAGQNLRPLSEIISGGEASRFMLALKNILAGYDDINVMVFDEIDAGISGEMGFKVAQKLANISREHQVICVSHLPQICAMADRNIHVAKNVVGGETIVSAKRLSLKQTFEEISELSGGSRTSEASINHSKELKDRCNKYKLSKGYITP